MSWASSGRRNELPADWPRTRRRILKRDPVCACAGCKHHAVTCNAPSTDVDHITRGSDHRDTNLRGLCAPCHAAKSTAEGVTARGYGSNRYRAAEKHPGRR